MDKVILFIGEGKKTWLNIKESKAFTVALADETHVAEADFFGIASGNKMNDKFERTGYHAVKSDRVNAPIIEEFPVVMECELLEFLDTEHVSGIVGKIVNVKAEESALSENGKIRCEKAAVAADICSSSRTVTIPLARRLPPRGMHGAGLMKK